MEDVQVMGAPEGNQFWKLRSKHGRDLLFKTPELLWEAACEYFEWCDEHPWQKTEATIGKNKNDVKTIPMERPYTLTGLCLYVNASATYWKEFKKNENLPQDFLPVITRIEEIIYTQKFEGAAVGTFNSNIIARDLGLSEKTDNKNINVNINSEPLSKDEIQSFNKALEDEY